MPRSFTVQICPETLFRRTLWIIAGLAAASLAAAFLALEMGHRQVFGLSDLVHLDRERNLPTIFSLVQLLFAGTVAWQMGTREQTPVLRGLWRFLGCGLFWMGLDEGMGIHERANKVNIGPLADISYFHFAWVVPAFFVVAACSAVLLKLLLALPRRTALLFVLSGAMFVAGSMGMEMLGAHYARTRHGMSNWSYTLCYTMEEVLEMTSVALFIRTALRHAIQTQPVPPPMPEAAVVSLPI